MKRPVFIVGFPLLVVGTVENGVDARVAFFDVLANSLFERAGNELYARGDVDNAVVGLDLVLVLHKRQAPVKVAPHNGLAVTETDFLGVAVIRFVDVVIGVALLADFQMRVDFGLENVDTDAGHCDCPFLLVEVSTGNAGAFTSVVADERLNKVAVERQIAFGISHVVFHLPVVHFLNSLDHLSHLPFRQ